MFVSKQLTDAISNALERYTGARHAVQVADRLHGGSINRCFQLKWADDLFFLKINSSSSFPGMFAAEAAGLELLVSTSSIKVPQVVGFGGGGQEQFLILEWIDSVRGDDMSQEKLGRALANLHKNSKPQFGLSYNNFMGSLTQSNALKESWSEFFIYERLVPQVELGLQAGMLTQTDAKLFDVLYKKLDSLHPLEPSALVHGDLWSGNYLIHNSGSPVLIDPAVSYSNREVDIAMTTLFGGFSNRFYGAYNETYPLQEGWQSRLKLWNLYPLLIHVNLFGKSYLGQLRSSLNQYV